MYLKDCPPGVEQKPKFNHVLQRDFPSYQQHSKNVIMYHCFVINCLCNLLIACEVDDSSKHRRLSE